jgi:hypothetical protein
LPEWLSLLLGFTLLILLPGGWLLSRTWGRARVRLAERRRELSSLPPEYRPHREPAAFWIAAWAGMIAGGYLGTLLDSDLAHLLLPAAVAAIFLGIYLWRESRQRAAVIRSVEARAPSMTHAELKSLVEALERVYPPSQMAAVRELEEGKREEAGLG